MARSWRDYAADNTDNRDDRAGSEAEPQAFVPNVPNVQALPALVRDGLTALGTMAAPWLQRPELWPEVVADAQRLATDGWASQALTLGWSALDLFGAVTDPAGDPEADGLAVKLNGRRVLALCGSFATVENGPNARAFIYRRTNEGARLLWTLGRDR